MPNFAKTEFSEVQFRAEECRSVRRVVWPRLRSVERLRRPQKPSSRLSEGVICTILQANF
jgi:hypothetical protein